MLQISKISKNKTKVLESFVYNKPHGSDVIISKFGRTTHRLKVDISQTIIAKIYFELAHKVQDIPKVYINGIRQHVTTEIFAFDFPVDFTYNREENSISPVCEVKDNDSFIIEYVTKDKF